MASIIVALKWLGSNLKAAVILFGTVLLAVIGYQRKVIKKQDHEIKIKDARHEQRQEQDVAIAENKEEEKEANEKFREDIINSDPDTKWDKL